MRGTLKTSTLEALFPLLGIENDCIVSKHADLTVAYRVTLPELFTLTGEEYEALHAAHGSRPSKCCPTIRSCTSRTGSWRSGTSPMPRCRNAASSRGLSSGISTSGRSSTTRVTFSLRSPHPSGCVRRAPTARSAGASSFRKGCGTRSPSRVFWTPQGRWSVS